MGPKWSSEVPIRIYIYIYIIIIIIYIYIYPTPHPKSSKSDDCQISAMTCYDSSMTQPGDTLWIPLEPDCCRAKELRAPSPGISWWWPSPKGQAPLSTGPLRWSRPPSSWRGQQLIHLWKRHETCACFLMWGIKCITVNHIKSPPTKFVGFAGEKVWKPFLLLHQPTSGKNDTWIHVTATVWFYDPIKHGMLMLLSPLIVVLKCIKTI